MYGHGARGMEQRAWSKGHGAWSKGMEQGAWSKGHGARGMEHGAKGMEQGAWSLGQGGGYPFLFSKVLIRIFNCKFHTFFIGGRHKIESFFEFR
jgi:hypothetical protein